MRPWVRVTRGAIAINFCLNQHFDGGKAALGFEPNRIVNLVSVATGSSIMVIMGKREFAFTQLLLIRFSKFLNITRICIKG